ncbi:MAG: NAD(P)-dependent alcohol dehydrogenase [Paracoccaceae bacterium]
MSVQTSRAWVHDRYGPPEVLRRIARPVPVPGPSEVLIEVHATTVSAADWRLRSLTMPPGLGWAGRLGVGIRGPRKPILGTDLSGVVAALGPGATRFAVGDEMVAFPGAALGAHAEHVVMAEDAAIVLKPASLTHVEAAAIPFGGTTAHDFLIRRGGVRAGEEVLIVGASGAVGTACVQIAAHLGARVTGVCRAANAKLVRALGAVEVIDRSTRNPLGDGKTYDVVIDAAGAIPWSRARHALRPGGRMLLIAGSGADMAFGPLRARLRGRRLHSGSAREDRATLTAVMDLAAAGVLRSVIDSVFGPDEMVAAHARTDTRRKAGAVVVRMRPD